jgi:hypothetical protein
MEGEVMEFDEQLRIVGIANTVISRAIEVMERLPDIDEGLPDAQAERRAQRRNSIHLCTGNYGRAKKAFNCHEFQRGAAHTHAALALHRNIIDQWPTWTDDSGCQKPYAEESYHQVVEASFQIEDTLLPLLTVKRSGTRLVVQAA